MGRTASRLRPSRSSCLHTKARLDNSAGNAGCGFGIPLRVRTTTPSSEIASLNASARSNAVQASCRSSMPPGSVIVYLPHDRRPEIEPVRAERARRLRQVRSRSDDAKRRFGHGPAYDLARNFSPRIFLPESEFARSAQIRLAANAIAPRLMEGYSTFTSAPSICNRSENPYSIRGKQSDSPCPIPIVGRAGHRPRSKPNL